jgi:hypothetical protein
MKPGQILILKDNAWAGAPDGSGIRRVYVRPREISMGIEYLLPTLYCYIFGMECEWRTEESESETGADT